MASWTAPSASASHSRGLASDEDRTGTRRLTRTLAPGILSLARLSMSFRISAQRQGVILEACRLWFLIPAVQVLQLEDPQPSVLATNDHRGEPDGEAECANLIR